MNDATQAAAQALQLPDAAYLGSDRAPFDRVLDTLAPGDDDDGTALPPVFALGAPAQLNPASHAQLPLVLLTRQDGWRRWAVDVRQNLSLVVVDLHSGQLRTVAPLKPTKRMATPWSPSRSGPAPEGVLARTVLRRLERLSIPSLMGEAWPAPAYAITAISHDWVSNTRVVQRRPAPEGLAAAHTAPTDFLKPAVLPSPVVRGLRFSLPTSVNAGAEWPVQVQVAEEADAISLLASAAPQAQSLMVAHLLLFKLDAASPVAVTLAMPVQRTASGGVTAAFSFDLAQRAEARNLEGHYQAYLVSGRTVVGPLPLTVGVRAAR